MKIFVGKNDGILVKWQKLQPTKVKTDKIFIGKVDIFKNS